MSTPNPNITVDHDEYRQVAAKLRALADRADSYTQEFEKIPDTMQQEIASHLTAGQAGKLYTPSTAAVGEIAGTISQQVPLLAQNLRNIAKSLDKYVSDVENQQRTDANRFKTA